MEGSEGVREGRGGRNVKLVIMGPPPPCPHSSMILPEHFLQVLPLALVFGHDTDHTSSGSHIQGALRPYWGGGGGGGELFNKHYSLGICSLATLDSITECHHCLSHNDWRASKLIAHNRSGSQPEPIQSQLATNNFSFSREKGRGLIIVYRDSLKMGFQKIL
jgi:hypothetical protein